MRKRHGKSCITVLLATCFAVWLPATEGLARTQANSKPRELETDVPTSKPIGKFGPKRTTPVFKGAWPVGMVLIAFPDTRMPPLAETKKKLFHFGPMTVSDYFKEYSQGVAWPELFVVGEAAFPKSVFTAPQPLGYYCEHDSWKNPLGYKDNAEGNTRAKELRAKAKAHAFKFHKRPGGRPAVVCYAFATKVVPPAGFKELIRPHYNGRMKSYDKTQEAWDLYKPKIVWGDPLWPVSIPQVHVEGGGGTVCHELGHVIGAPDYYHAPEPHDGVPGVPCLSWAYGPTGPGYCRYIYNAYLTAKNYPTITKSGSYGLYPRSTNPAGDKPVGCFVQSAHPNYVYYLEYVRDEKAPLGNPGKQGLLVHVINRTLNSPLLGGPDLCYTYRPGDPWFRSEGNAAAALLGRATGRTSFTTSTDPASRLPNLLPGGVAITDVQEVEQGAKFTLTLEPQRRLSSTAYKYSLVPKVRLDEVTDALPTSVRAACTITFRGEPMKTDYGFCFGTAPKPKVPTSTRSAFPSKAKHFPLYHRDRYEGRMLGMRPNTTYYVRAYARNPQGVSYSSDELKIKTPALTPPIKAVPPLLEDKFSGAWCIEMYHGFAHDKEGDFIGSAAITTLLKLTAYYRTSLGSKKASRSRTRTTTRSSSRSKSSKPEKIIDYTRIHMQPTLSRPKFRMKEFWDAVSECKRLADAAGMRANNFSDDFDKTFVESFGMRASRTMKVQPIAKLDAAAIPKLTPHIIESLVQSRPVVVGQASVQLSPRGHGLSWVIIDGVDEQGRFHLVYPRKHDRDFKHRKTGWYSLDVLLDKVFEARIIFGFNPLGS